MIPVCGHEAREWRRFPSTLCFTVEWPNTKNLFHPTKSSVSGLSHDFKEFLDSNRNTWFNILYLHCLVEILKSGTSSIFLFCLKIDFITNKGVHLLKYRNYKCHYTKSHDMISDLLKQSEKCEWSKFNTAVPNDWLIGNLCTSPPWRIFCWQHLYFLYHIFFGRKCSGAQHQPILYSDFQGIFTACKLFDGGNPFKYEGLHNMNC